MCMIDLVDGDVRVSESVVRRAAREHACGECDRTITRGEPYEYVSLLVWDGSAEWTHAKTCAHCLIARRWLQRECGGWIYGSLLEDLIEHFREGAVIRDRDVLRLGRLIVGMRNKWQRFGVLGPLPEVV